MDTSKVSSAVRSRLMDFSKYLKNETFKTIKNAVVFVVDPGTGSTLLHSAPMLDINLDLGNL